MTLNLRRILGTLAAALLLAYTAAAAEPGPDGLIASPEPGWPQWRGPRRDGLSDEKGLLPSWPAGGPRLLWKTGALGLGWSSPIVVGDRLYVTGDVEDDLVIFAFDSRGNRKWQVKSGQSWKGSFPGARACCAYSEGRLYHLNAHGRVVCLEAATGNEVWAVNVLEAFQGRNIVWALSECLLVDGPRLIVTPGGAKALMVALDKRTGRPLWTTEPLGQDKATYSSPLLFRHAGRRLLANCSSSHGFGVDADTGKLLWSVEVQNRHEVNVATPVYSDGCVFYVTATGTAGALYRLRADGQGIRAEPAWQTPLDTCTGGVILADGILYGSGYSRFKHWLSLDWPSGKILHELKDMTSGSAVYADGRLYCLAEDGRVAMLKPTGGGLEIVSEFLLLGKRARETWAHPVLLDGRLYLRHHDALWCYDVRKP